MPHALKTFSLLLCLFLFIWSDKIHRSTVSTVLRAWMILQVIDNHGGIVIVAWLAHCQFWVWPCTKAYKGSKPCPEALGCHRISLTLRSLLEMPFFPSMGLPCAIQCMQMPGTTGSSLVVAVAYSWHTTMDYSLVVSLWFDSCCRWIWSSHDLDDLVKL